MMNLVVEQTSTESGAIEAFPAGSPVGQQVATAPKAEAAGTTSALPGKKGRAPRLMIVDDVEVNIVTVQTYLKKYGYSDVTHTTDPRQTMSLIRKCPPDLLLLDIQMPEISGIDILRMLNADPIYRHIPVIVLTADTDPKTKTLALQLGVSDFLTKPIDPHDLVPRVRNALLIKAHRDRLAAQAASLEKQVQERTKELHATQQQLILSLARAAEHRDNDTANHVLRVGRYAGLIARQLGYPADDIGMLEMAAQLHDVGKIGVPDAILLKPGKLEDHEFEIMKRHCAFGKSIVEPISGKEREIMRRHTMSGASILDAPHSPMLRLAARIAQTHHERWDGTGYPLGLAGEDIPLEGRITSVADVYDALSTKRSYKPAFPRAKCFKILEEGRGTQFDPAVLDAFFAVSSQIIEVQLDLMDD